MLRLAAGTYSLTVSDENDCTAVIEELTINSTCGCDADAGSISAATNPVCIEGTSGIISATPAGNMVVPAGFEISYVLTEGEALTIMQVASAPTFTVTEAGNYTIHTLVFDLSLIHI